MSKSDRAALVALAERCEKAEWPDRTLDVEIALALGWTPQEDVTLKERDPARRWWHDDKGYNWNEPKNWTESLDSAMTLVPKGWKFGLEQFGKWDGEQVVEAWCWPFDSDFEPYWRDGQQGYRDAADAQKGFAVTPALALCAAALRAQAEGLSHD